MTLRFLFRACSNSFLCSVTDIQVKNTQESENAKFTYNSMYSEMYKPWLSAPKVARFKQTLIC